MTRSAIEWCDRSDWNPLRGCTRVSPGCGGPGPHGGCYAEAIAARFSDPGQPFHGYVERTKSGPRWTGKVELIEERLTAPQRWRKPARIFALSMSDLFHESVPDEWIHRIFSVMERCPDHTFQVLTKRAARMRDYCSARAVPFVSRFEYGFRLPLANVWLGVSVEDQARADERIPLLLDTPAATRWVSLEPLLSAVDISPWVGLSAGPHWYVIGGESGPGARPFKIEWARSIVAQCRIARIPCFVKQLGALPIIEDERPFNGGFPDGTHFGNRSGRRELNGLQALLRDSKGGDMAEWPPDLRVREYPEERA